MSYGLSAPVLVLNRNFVPVRVTTARMAFELLYQGRAHAIDEQYELHDFASWSRLVAMLHPHHEAIRTVRGAVRVPRVVVLAAYNRVPATILRLSRRNVYLRDNYTCQYCGTQPGADSLNLDHVIPRSRGGPGTWDNLVTSCKPCNLRKGRALPEECGMVPMNPPRVPRWTAAVEFQAVPRRFDDWEPFLGNGNGAAVRKAG
jgi:5-methylcytosine-specific restriction endonuclease McrA